MVLINTYDTASPDGQDDPAEADDRMRETKAAVQERMNDKDGSANGGDHFWPLTGTEVSDTDTGEHRKVTLRVRSAPTKLTDKGIVYVKDVSNKAELFYIDEDGKEVQITSGGKILSASLDSKDEDDMASDSASHTATQQSIKAFVGAVDSADDFSPSTYAGEESITFPNGLILKTGSAPDTGTNTTVTFDEAFPNAIISVSLTSRLSTGGTVVTSSVISKSLSNFVAFNSEVLDAFEWIAIGY